MGAGFHPVGHPAAGAAAGGAAFLRPGVRSPGGLLGDQDHPEQPGVYQTLHAGGAWR